MTHNDLPSGTPNIKTRSFSEHARMVLTLGLPLAASQLAQFALHMTDVVMMGWYGLDELAALVLATGFWFIIFIFIAGFAFSVMPLVAKASGEGDITLVRRATRMAMWLSILAAILVYPIFLFSAAAFEAMGQDAHIAKLAQPYLIIAGIEMVPALIALVFRSYFSALERTRAVLIAAILATVVNAGLNYVLIFGNFGAPELGIAGAAVASLIVSTLTMIGLAVYAQIVTPENELFRNIFKPDWEVFGRVLKMGVPIGLTSLAEVSLFNVASLMMGWISIEALAAHGIAMQLSAVAFMVQIGLSQAGTIRAGNAFGRKDEADLRAGARVVTLMSMGMAAITCMIYFSIPEILIGLFIAPDEPQRDAVLAIGATLLIFSALFQFADGGQVVALSLLRGVQDTAIPFWLASISYWAVGLPVAYIFAFVVGWGASGVWVGLLVGLSVACAMMTWRFWAYKSRITSDG
ncbi:MATE family efflux transporter [Pacificibacter marinus]|uniref:Multidrug-efflux transporter n=1 Tax=Pacificibacter marinus TaxID=658057 RepID=A0A1Y5SRE4_9RHOB|nr:MATE family efflux transporter [Pacificibacter marinus]SEK66968.1 multidrug resistance protein, MATE family [Pacificibacter marinus]SLN46565.1 Multidrug resistance protein MdtK [Pacificibacter marinus]